MKKNLTIFLIVFFLSFLFFNINSVNAATKRIGDKCNHNTECISGDCEDGFCDCSNAGNCATEYGSYGDWTCVDENNLSYGLDFCKNNDGTIKYPLPYGLAIGEVCFNNSNCISQDCEKSNQKSTAEIDPWNPRDEVSYCDCNDDNDCAIAYGTSGKWRCTDGANTSYDIDYCKDETTGVVKLPFDANNNTGFWGSLTDMALDPQAYTKNLGENLAKDFQAPQPKINIPGLTFSDPDLEKIMTIDEVGNTYLSIPFLGEYVAGIFKYLIIFATISSVVIIIVSGIQWILSAGNSDIISDQKKRILGAIIGLILIFASYTILYIINPYLVTFSDLKVLYIPQNLYSVPQENEGLENQDLLKVETPLGNKSYTVEKPEWTHSSFNCNDWKSKRFEAYKPAGVTPSQYTKTYSCPEIVDPKTKLPITITTISEMQEAVCKAGKNATTLGYQLVITSSYRSFESQADLWCGEGAQKFPDTATRKKFYAVPGNSIHGLGQAVDVFLYDKNGTRLTFFGASNQCKSDSKNVGILSNIFYNTSQNFFRLENEIWHFEFTKEPINELRVRTSELPKSCK